MCIRDRADKETLNPTRDYLVGLLIALLIVFVSALYATQLFFNLSQQTKLSVTNLDSVVGYNHQVIDRAIDLYTARAK